MIVRSPRSCTKANRTRSLLLTLCASAVTLLGSFIVNGCASGAAPAGSKPSQPGVTPANSSSTQSKAAKPATSGVPAGVGVEAEKAAIEKPLGPISKTDQEMAANAPEPTPTAKCESVLKRPISKVIGTEQSIGHFVALVPGEKICVEFETKGSALIPIRAVEKAEYPEKTLQISLAANSGGSMLTVTSPFGRSVRYHSIVVLENRDASTTLCPLPPMRRSSENWPDTFMAVLLHNFTQLSADDDRSCGR